MSAVTQESLAEGIVSLLASFTTPLDQLPPITPTPTLPTTEAQVSRLIDHTLLAPNATLTQISAICEEAKAYNTATVCVNSSMIPYVAQHLAGTSVLPISVIGFPFVSSITPSKVLEAKVAVQQGAKEIDMVNNIGLLRSQQYLEVYSDIKAVAEACHSHHAKLKVILETAMLTKQEIVAASYIACLAGADFVKTSTGYGGPGATKEDVRLMYEVASRTDLGWDGSKKQVKASGGVRSLETVREMVKNGATRVGASGTKAIVQQIRSGAAAATTGSDNY
ncbi:related to Deoxyribose-phosphate aldolase [Melanopsichium pennsylvanicum]|uniref:deoxyribose-phosphate aldolase n=2 Tax=Melanopsichium pennsylvanicum TaxID=63383 RepID=A0AAJ5C3J4_9BASI|nr:related to Deoxyribose-phosphate aldolase [Melanopsichium pennsylvanicum 4]SNX82588.1 related to Deoxyribose-phosphate aldolase [Melanopsichium pennsylvanicum]